MPLYSCIDQRRGLQRGPRPNNALYNRINRTTVPTARVAGAIPNGALDDNDRPTSPSANNEADTAADTGFVISNPGEGVAVSVHEPLSPDSGKSVIAASQHVTATDSPPACQEAGGHPVAGWQKDISPATPERTPAQHHGGADSPSGEESGIANDTP